MLTALKDVYAGDVMCHANCFKKYIRQFQRDVGDLMKILEESTDNDSGKYIVFEEVITKLELDKCGYALSAIRDLLN